MPNYSDIIKKAYQTTIKYKFLWFFGFLFALTGGGGNNFNFISNINTSGSNNEALQRGFDQVANKVSSIDVAILAIIGIVLFALFILFIIIKYISHSALIGTINDIEDNKKVSISRGFENGWRYALKLFAVDFLVNLAAFAIFSVVIIVLLILLSILLGPGIFALAAEETVLGTILLIFGGMISFAIFLSVIVTLISLGVIYVLVGFYSRRYLIVKKEGIVSSIKMSLRLIKKETTPSLVIWIISVGLGIAAVIVTIIPFLLLIVPIIFIAIANWIVAIILAIPVGLLFFFVQGIVATYFQAYWTLSFRSIIGKK